MQSIYFKDNALTENREPQTGFHTSQIVNIGLSEYETALQLQKDIHESVASEEASEVIVITEHFPVYTCGRRTREADKPYWSRIPVIDVERGGELTWHGPGQIVGYPILNLAKRRLSIPRYLRRLEEALIASLQRVGLEAKYREEFQAGLWVGDRKVVSIGIAVRKQVTFHGFALNCDCDLKPFWLSKPCGLTGDRVTSLKELGTAVSKEEMQTIVIKELKRTFFE